MRGAGKCVSKILSTIAKEVRPGISLLELDQQAKDLAAQMGVKCAFLGYMGFPGAVCTSVNDQIVHGIPTGRRLEEGDVVGLDFGVVKDGFYGDSAVTIPVGKISDDAKKLLKATAQSLYAAIEVSRAGNTLKDIARAIEGVVKPHGYGIVRDFVGHGIGTKLHEDPQIPNYVAGAQPFTLRAGMTIAIEPMINGGSEFVKVLDDKWTAVTEDGSLSAHYEHSLVITDGEPEILTEWEGGRFGGLLDSL